MIEYQSWMNDATAYYWLDQMFQDSSSYIPGHKEECKQALQRAKDAITGIMDEHSDYPEFINEDDEE